MNSNGLHSRIKTVRKSLTPKVSQTAFAEMLGTSRRAITTYETGVVTPSDTFIQLLCTKFNINEEWLRTGKGTMHKNDIEAQVDAFAQTHILSPEEREIMRYFFRLAPKERAAMIEHLIGIADAIRSARTSITPDTQTEIPAASAAIEAKVAAYREQLIAEEKGLSASSSGNRNIEKA